MDTSMIENQINRYHNTVTKLLEAIYKQQLTGNHAQNYLRKHLPTVVRRYFDMIWKPYTEQYRKQLVCDDKGTYGKTSWTLYDFLLLWTQYGIVKPEQLPVCPYCNRNKVQPNNTTGLESGLRRMFWYFEQRNKGVDTQQISAYLYPRCACKSCYTKFMQRQHEKALINKYGVRNINELESIRKIKSEKQKRNFAQTGKSDQILYKRQLSTKPGALTGKETDTIAQAKLLIARKLGATRYVDPKTLEEHMHQRQGTVELIKNSAYQEALKQLLLDLNKRSRTVKCISCEQAIREDRFNELFRWPTRTDAKYSYRWQFQCQRCGTTYIQDVSDVTRKVLIPVVLHNMTFDELFDCPYCSKEGTKITEQGTLIRFRSQVERQVVSNLAQIVKEAEISISPIDRTILPGYEIDIALFKSDGQFVYGIEIDGENWHAHDWQQLRESRLPNKWKLIVERGLPITGYPVPDELYKHGYVPLLTKRIVNDTLIALYRLGYLTLGDVIRHWQQGSLVSGLYPLFDKVLGIGCHLVQKQNVLLALDAKGQLVDFVVLESDALNTVSDILVKYSLHPKQVYLKALYRLMVQGKV